MRRLGVAPPWRPFQRGAAPRPGLLPRPLGKSSPLLLIAVALLAGAIGVPPAAGFGMGNARPVVIDLSASANPASVGSVVTFLATATDDGSVVRFAFTATGGRFTNGTAALVVPVASPGSPAVVQATWTADTAGTYTVTCSAWDNGGLFNAPSAESLPASLEISLAVPSGPSPLIEALRVTPPRLFVGDVARLDVQASDPAGGALTYTWTASAGSLSALGPSAAPVTAWLAPTQPGTYEVRVSVANATGQQGAAAVLIEAIWATAGAPLCAGLGLYPERLALDPAGNVFVADPRARAIRVFTALGGALREIPVAGTPSGIAIGPTGTVYAGDIEHGRVDAYTLPGERLPLGRGDGEFVAPRDLAIAGDRIYVADSDAGAVRVFATDTRQPVLTIPCGLPVSVAVDAAAARLYVGDAQTNQVRVFSTTGANVSPFTIGRFGSGRGELTRLGGVALTRDGKLCVVDTFQSAVSVFATDGSFSTRLGSNGTAPGELRLPLGIATDSFGRVLVGNADNARLEVFRTAAATTPSRSGDTDMDGMPDAWETAHGRDPFDPADAFADADQDGLTNLEEFVFGTDPRKADSDGDGVADIDEILAGGDPLDPNDAPPLAVVGPDRVTDPTLVTLDGSRSRDGRGRSLAYEWTVSAAPETPVLAGADTPTPELVLRTAGLYVFRLRVNNGRTWSAPVETRLQVRNLAPTADAGPTISAATGQRVVLDGRFSTDANRDPLTYAWQQTAGPAIALLGSTTPRAAFVPRAAGIYGFTLVVHDPAQESSPSPVWVLVDAPRDHVPVAAVAARLFGSTGSAVRLDGTASLDLDRDPLTYAWQQVSGQPVDLTRANAAVATFAPTLPGVYGFELTVADGHHRSLPAAVTVFAAAPAAPLPVAEAGYDQRVVVFADVTLNGSWSAGRGAGPVAGVFRQVEGVRVPLTNTGATAHFVPIEPGTYTFELDVEGGRDLVSVVVDDPPRCVVPVALTSATTGTPPVPLSPAPRRWQDRVTLHAEGSVGLGTTPGFVWTQLAGPHVTLTDARAATPSFEPPAKARYAFAVRVDNGAVRSPAVRRRLLTRRHVVLTHRWLRFAVMFGYTSHRTGILLAYIAENRVLTYATTVREIAGRARG